MNAQECPPEQISKLIEIAQADDERGLAQADRLLLDYTLDSRLHFLRGSLLASLRRYPEAHTAMQRAVEIAPAFAIARFQLGLLELSSGDAAAAEATLRPFDDMAPDNPLRLFATGLRHLMRDEFAETIDLLEKGIALNTEHPPVSADMQLLINETRKKLAEQAASDEPVSAAHMLLKKYDAKPTKH